MNGQELITSFVKIATDKGFPADAALRFFKDLQFEALANIMLKKGYMTQAEWDFEHERLVKSWGEQFENMMPPPSVMKNPGDQTPGASSEPPKI